jgi:hypothetical protein
MTVRTTVNLAPATVTDVATGRVRALRTPRRTAAAPVPVATRAMPQRAVDAAMAAAGGNSSRLHFAADGSVWVLNHSRAVHCPSPVCPACAGDGR